MISDLHTHTTYCDGANTPEEMLLSAIDKDFKAYGFSSHSHLSYDEDWNMTHAAQEKYVVEILSLKEKYKDKILVLCGIESDIVAKHDDFSYDYVISSAHYIKAGDGFMDVDESKEKQQECIDLYYGGDPYA